MMRLAWTFAGLALLRAAAFAEAQQSDPLSRLPAAVRREIASIVDSARAANLPSEPLISKALEGTSKGAPPARIVAVVRQLARSLDEAARALGDGASEPELVAGATATQAGVNPRVLLELRASRPGQTLTTALVVMADMVARGVPPDIAGASIARLARAGASDPDLLALRVSIERDITAGVPPAAAASTRAGILQPPGEP
jgi:hypothetical protein